MHNIPLWMAVVFVVAICLAWAIPVAVLSLCLNRLFAWRALTCFFGSVAIGSAVCLAYHFNELQLPHLLEQYRQPEIFVLAVRESVVQISAMIAFWYPAYLLLRKFYKAR